MTDSSVLEFEPVDMDSRGLRIWRDLISRLRSERKWETREAPKPEAPSPQVVREREVIREREIINIRCSHCGTLVDQGVPKCPSCGAPM